MLLILRKCLHFAARYLLGPFLLVVFPRISLDSIWFNPGFTGYSWCIRSLWQRNILRLGPPLPWPCHLTCTISNSNNIVFHPDDLNNFQAPGTYFQCFKAKIIIGRGTYIAPNVGIITCNHDRANLMKHDDGKDIIIDESCWIGMNSVILPGVYLGPRTVVGAGAVVSKSFPSSDQLVAGVPAKIIKNYQSL